MPVKSLVLQPEAFHLKGSTRKPAGLLLLLPTLAPQHSLNTAQDIEKYQWDENVNEAEN